MVTFSHFIKLDKYFISKSYNTIYQIDKILMNLANFYWLALFRPLLISRDKAR